METLGFKVCMFEQYLTAQREFVLTGPPQVSEI